MGACVLVFIAACVSELILIQTHGNNNNDNNNNTFLYNHQNEEKGEDYGASEEEDYLLSGPSAVSHINKMSEDGEDYQYSGEDYIRKEKKGTVSKNLQKLMDIMKQQQLKKAYTQQTLNHTQRNV